MTNDFMRQLSEGKVYLVTEGGERIAGVVTRVGPWFDNRAPSTLFTVSNLYLDLTLMVLPDAEEQNTVATTSPRRPNPRRKKR